MNTEWIEIECDFCHGEGYDEDSLTIKDGINTENVCGNCNGAGVIFELNLNQNKMNKNELIFYTIGFILFTIGFIFGYNF